jgi:beta-lactamase superfamily II metal-dependent hydrolase
VSLFFAFVSCIFLYTQTQHNLTVSVLDVGQGDAILLVTPSHHTMLIDGGAANIVLDRLSKQLPYGTKTIDVILATHPDADHITGLIPVLEKYNVKHIVVSPHGGDTDIVRDLVSHITIEEADVHVAQTGDALDFHDGVHARILYPYKNYTPTKDTNDASVSMVVMYDDMSFLLTGDLPIQKERYLLQEGVLPHHITVYKAGHHGSKTSSSEQLLSYIKPEYAVISAGAENKYGHPHQETLTRLEMYAKEIISTIDKGTISFITDGHAMRIVTTK